MRSKLKCKGILVLAELEMEVVAKIIERPLEQWNGLFMLDSQVGLSESWTLDSAEPMRGLSELVRDWWS